MPNIDQALANLLYLVQGSGGGAGPLFTLLGVISDAAGVYFVVRGIMLFRAFGQHITMASRNGELAGPVTFIVVGILMINIDQLADIGMVTLYGDSEVAEFSSQYLTWAGSVSDQFAQLSNVIYWYLKFIGALAFLRGWFILAKMGHPGAQPGSVAKGVTHVVGGLLLMNIIETVNLFAITFGYGSIIN